MKLGGPEASRHLSIVQRTLDAGTENAETRVTLMNWKDIEINIGQAIELDVKTSKPKFAVFKSNHYRPIEDC